MPADYRKVCKIAPNTFESIFNGFHFIVERNKITNECHAYCQNTGYGFRRRSINMIRQHLNDLKAVIKENN